MLKITGNITVTNIDGPGSYTATIDDDYERTDTAVQELAEGLDTIVPEELQR